MANALGRAMRYMVEAWRYASYADAGARKRLEHGETFAEILDRLSERDKHSQDETVDTDRVYRLSLTNVWVYSALSLIGGRVAATDARISAYRYVGEETEEIENHPFELLLDRPNSLMSGSFLLRYLYNWYGLSGNAYAILDVTPGASEPPRAIWPYPSNLMRPLPGTLREGVGIFAGQAVVDYQYNIGGVKRRIPGEIVVHFRTPNPFDYWQGLSPLTAARMAVELDHAQRVWQRDFFAEDNAIPSSIVSLPREVNRPDFERIRDQFKDAMARGEKRIITRAGDLSVDVISQTLEQMQVLESREFTRQEVDRVYLIPEGLISGGLSGDSRLAAEIAFARNAVQPTIDYFAEQLTSDVAPYYADDVVFLAPNVVPQDRALEVQEYTIYSQDRSIEQNLRARNLDVEELPNELAPLRPLMKVPVRLLPIAGQLLHAPLLPDRPAPVENDAPDVGSLGGAQDPAQMADEQAGKAFDIALDAELKRWRKVARKSLRSEGNAAARDFASDVIPADLHERVMCALRAARTESEVDAAFDAAPFLLDWRAYP